jgi:predicted transcriptional regulator
LSAAIAQAVEQLAVDLDRSRSWIVRDMLRRELRQRGLLAPAPEVDTALSA